jgi:hypothetical protein
LKSFNRPAYWLAVLSLVFCAGVRAESIIFKMGAGSGTIAYGGDNSPLTGSIAMTSVRGTGTPYHAGVDYAVNAMLTFATGEYEETENGELVFSAGGDFRIHGTIAALGIVNPTDLLWGSFLGASFDPTFGRTSLMLGTGTDTKNPDLVAWFFGSETPNFEFSGTMITYSVDAQLASTGQFSTNVKTASIVNVATAVPENSSLSEFIVMLVATASMLAVAKIYRRTTH